MTATCFSLLPILNGGVYCDYFIAVSLSYAGQREGRQESCLFGSQVCESEETELEELFLRVFTCPLDLTETIRTWAESLMSK